MQIEITLSNSLQDYLEGILNLAESHEKVRITDLAEHLGITKPSATGAAKTLVKMGLLHHDKYGPLELTGTGLEVAGEVRRRHNLLKEFLVSVLGVPVKTAEAEACLMEHSISPDTFSKLVDFLETHNGTP